MFLVIKRKSLFLKSWWACHLETGSIWSEGLVAFINRENERRGQWHDRVVRCRVCVPWRTARHSPQSCTITTPDITKKMLTTCGESLKELYPTNLPTETPRGKEERNWENISYEEGREGLRGLNKGKEANICSIRSRGRACSARITGHVEVWV